MTSKFTTTAIVAAATLFVAAAPPAMARDHHHGYRHHGNVGAGTPDLRRAPFWAARWHRTDTTAATTTLTSRRRPMAGACTGACATTVPTMCARKPISATTAIGTTVRKPGAASKTSKGGERGF